MEEELDFVFEVKYNNNIHNVSDKFNIDNELNFISVLLKDEDELNFGENVNLVFVKYPEPSNEETFEVILLTLENKEDPLSKYADLKEKDGKKYYYLYLEIKTYEKFRLRVFYYGPKEDIKSLEDIKRFCESLIDENSTDFIESNDDNYKLFDSETYIDDIESNDNIVVITTGRFISHVLEKIGSKANSVLIYTSSRNVNDFRQLYKNEKYKQVKEVSIDIRNLLNNLYFFPDLNRYLETNFIK